LKQSVKAIADAGRGQGSGKALADEFRIRIHFMKRIFAAALLGMLFASPAFAAKHTTKQAHHKYDYRYRTPKYKVPKTHNHKSHPHNPSKNQSK